MQRHMSTFLWPKHTPECATGDGLRAHGLRVQLVLISAPDISKAASKAP